MLGGVLTQGFINLIIFWRTPFSGFVRKYIFREDSTHSFINEAPGLYAISTFPTCPENVMKIPA